MFKKEQLISAKEAFLKLFKGVDGILGVGIGDNCVHVMLLNNKVKKQIPAEIEGVPIRTKITGRIIPL